MIQLFVAVVVLVLLELVVVRFGADSRDSDDWVSHRHLHPNRSARKLPV